MYEDALTLLSYASPYPVLLLLEKSLPGADRRLPTASAGRPVHPFYRSQSIDDLAKVGLCPVDLVKVGHCLATTYRDVAFYGCPLPPSLVDVALENDKYSLVSK